MDRLNKAYAAIGRNFRSEDENDAFFNTQSVQLVDALAIEYDKFILFESEGFEILAVVAHARISVLRFRYNRNGVDYKCDLSFENELSVWNTRLLRAYASYDERARDVGLAVKHWAKQRSVSDTASGFLSSYSYVLMSIYYLQVVDILPNLQDPELVHIAEIPTLEHDFESIAFCEDRDTAKIYHGKSIHADELVDKSVITTGGFEYYTTQFDCIKHVVAVSVVQKTEL